MSYKYPLQVNLYIGVPGAGKTTLAAHIAKKAIKHNVPVWSNVPIKGTFQLDPKNDMGKYDISKGRVIIDEAGVDFNNRNYMKNIPDDMLYWLKRHRHYDVAIDLFSQGLDCDKKFITLARNIYIVSKSLIPFFLKYKRVVKKVGVDSITKQLIDEYIIVPFSARYVFMPTKWKMFDTKEHKPLPTKEWIKH